MSKTRRTGTINKRRENSWQVRLSIGGDHTGKRKFHTATIRGTKKEAEKYLNKIIREKDLGSLIDTPAITLNEFFDRWLETVSRIRTSEVTSYGHESKYNRYFRKTIG